MSFAGTMRWRRQLQRLLRVCAACWFTQLEWHQIPDADWFCEHCVARTARRRPRTEGDRLSAVDDGREYDAHEHQSSTSTSGDESLSSSWQLCAKRRRLRKLRRSGEPDRDPRSPESAQIPTHARVRSFPSAHHAQTQLDPADENGDDDEPIIASRFFG